MKKNRLWIIIPAALALLAAVTALCLANRPAETADNLLTNGGFEDLRANSLPEVWYTDAYIPTAGYTVFGTDEGRSGNAAAYIQNNAANDARFAQTVSVRPDTLYYLHGYVKADAEGGHGANLSIGDVYAFSDSVYDTNGEWTELALYGRTGSNQTSVTLFARLGGYSGEATGEAWFDDITFTQVSAVPDGYTELPLSANVHSGSAPDGLEGISPVWIVRIVCAFIVLALMILRYWRSGRLYPLAGSSAAPQCLQPAGRMLRKDWLIVLGATAVYACLAFFHLGAVTAPQTAYTFENERETVVFDLGKRQDAFTILYYSGIHWADSHFYLQVSNNGTNWSEYCECPIATSGPEFKWHYAYGGAEEDDRVFSGRYVRLTARHIGLTLFEILFRDTDGNVLSVQSVVDSLNADPSALIDEQETLSGEPGWFNSMYFDEIYHARTAYEHLHGLRTFETSHPPLGKVLMSFSIAVFGMTPFGWRFAGTLCGVLMLPCMYMLGRLLFKKRRYAALPMLLMAFDCMHYAQTRIATIDSFVVLFILWSVYFMLRWFMDESAGLRQALTRLGLSGLFFGMACASKWSGLYAGAGLAVLFFYGIWRRIRIIRYASGRPHQSAKQLWITAASCLVFFAAVPALIYYCSYIPYFAYVGGVTLRRVVNAAVGMYRYHSTPGLGMDHQFHSPWYEWPLSIRPMYFTRDTYEPPGYASSILSFGNPAVWWIGLIALLIVILLFLWQIIRLAPLYAQIAARHSRAVRDTRQDVRISILLICFAAQFLPWTLVPRGTYIYHYFTCVPFIILCTTLVFEYIETIYLKRVYERTLRECSDPETAASQQKKASRTILIVLASYIAVTAIVFGLLFPYASGLTVMTQWRDAVNWFGNLYY